MNPKIYDGDHDLSLDMVQTKMTKIMRWIYKIVHGENLSVNKW